ncbi:MAG: hypothetical protein CM15mP18_2840 [Methanobacteriota archaeon]|nr:MAG: hypothetical protein CM15mP18_2840 [Euryarchaeota archaeon]
MRVAVGSSDHEAAWPSQTRGLGFTLAPLTCGPFRAAPAQSKRRWWAVSVHGPSGVIRFLRPDSPALFFPTNPHHRLRTLLIALFFGPSGPSALLKPLYTLCWTSVGFLFTRFDFDPVRLPISRGWKKNNQHDITVESA